ncbi:unnamed protein product [Prorocentrum cordatum]|uniref:Uncharacterized protein n=1 Tax=Prorocentrum cordatum TaxID=2364126 RepID=A0ABN9PMK7_9DINO|nr:unnamed protein product [Polarella glacialis]
MEEVSQKQGSISYQQFRDYVCKQNQSDVVELTHHRSIFAAGSGSDLDDDDLGAAQHYRSGHIQSLVADLDNELMTMGSSEASSTENDSAFPLFHAWLDQIMEDSGEGADFGHGLTYADQRIESLYIGHNMETTSSHMCMLMTASFCYSVWNMCQSGFRWDPTIVVWDNKVRIAYNLAWMFLAVFSVCVFLVCWRWTRMEKRLQAMKPSVRNEDARDREAVRLERRLCACFCLVPWVGFLFAQRFRVATLFGEDDPDDIFSSRNSDYDLIITIIALLMFISTRTRIRWCCCCLMAASSCLSYCVTALLLGFAESCKDGSSQRGDPAWPGVVLVVVCILNLCGHYSVEYQRRVVFLSFYASYEVLRESFEEDHTAGESFQQVSKEPVKTSVAQINRSLSLVKKLSNSSDLFSKPMRNALKTMVEALQNSKQEVVQADVLKIVDVMEILDKVNVWGKTRDQLLTQFDSLPTKLQSPEDGGPSSSSRTAPFSGGLLASPAEAHPEAWGWDTISRLPGQGFAPQLEQADLAARPGRGSMTDRPARPLLVAAEQTLLPAVADMVESADDARQLAQKLLAGLQRCYDRAPRGAESRAALALHAGHWLCRRLGVWRQLEPFERVAFAVAAAGLHTGAGGTGGRGGALGVGDPLLRVAASLARTLSALDESGLVEAATGVAGQAASASMSSSRNSVDRSAGDLRHLVRQLLARQQPRVVLADVRRVHCSLQSDLLLWSDEAQRTATMALVLAAGDLAFLALPRALHLPWVALMRHEVSGELDVTACLRGLGEALALPVFRTPDAGRPGLRRYRRRHAVPRGELQGAEVQAPGLEGAGRRAAEAHGGGRAARQRPVRLLALEPAA